MSRATGVSVPGSMKECQHARGGVCRVHGPGAKKKFRPVRVTVFGQDGKEVTRIKQKSYYTCDVGTGGTRLLQTRLSFIRDTTTRKVEKRDQKGYLGPDCDDTVGQ